MSPSMNLDTDAVGDKIAVAVATAVAEAVSKQRATFQSQNAALIGEEVSRQVNKEIKQVAAAIENAMLDLKKPTFDVRQQIVGMY